MKVCISSNGPGANDKVDPRFGRASYFIIYDTETKECGAVDNTTNVNAAGGAGTQSAQVVINEGCDVVITGNIGPKAFQALNAANIKIFSASDITVTEAIEKFEKNELNSFQSSNVQGKW